MPGRKKPGRRQDGIDADRGQCKRAPPHIPYVSANRCYSKCKNRKGKKLRKNTAAVRSDQPLTENNWSRQAKAWTPALRTIICAAMKRKAYARAGGDIDLGNRVKA